MGFGLICAGYATLLYFRLIPAELIGFFFVLKGLKKLSGYNKYFNIAHKCTFFILAFSLVDAVYWFVKYFGSADFAFYENILTNCHRIVFFPFYISLFLALREISQELAFKKGIKRSTFALSVTFVYYVTFVALKVNIPTFRQYFQVAEILLYIILFFSTESAVYACYKAITTDEAENKEEERLEKFNSRFGHKKIKNTKSTVIKTSQRTYKGTASKKKK